MADEFLSPSAYATHRGVDRSRVSRWIQGGKIPPKAIEGAGRAMRIDVALADAALLQTLDKGQQLAKTLKGDRPGRTEDAKAPPPRVKPAPKAVEPHPEPVASPEAPPTDDGEGDGADPDYSREKARLAKEQADAQAMRNAATRREMLDAGEVVQRWSAIVSGARSALLAVPKRLRDVLPDLSPSDLAKIDAEIRRALMSLGDGRFATG